ncbi:MAG: hypothetical protein QGI68_00670 [Pseudomonadales bacterium]|jgi:hypothetical protein|nr:hypothetical protein [Pseudomonadales bacterium]MDP7360863.1 hypothetical protein [Pseudomonadales bacterium]MDP7594071.1 hypothetical protein [Pseudomonadales bacterium]HJN49550.1 hypothetical protein [Pseudomonadales bacterium]|tara:strand:- start:133 stop:780 length:648 start_codon:yes stop_codon:yes gene_type:complete
MNPLVSLKEIEKKAYRSTFQDGLWDIFFGLVLLGWTVPALLSEIGFTSPLYDLLMPLLAVLVLFFGKRWITIPRMGLVTFGPKRQVARMRTIMVLTLSLGLVLLLLITSNMQTSTPAGSTWDFGQEGYGRSLVAGLFALTVLSATAYFMEFSRLYIIAVIVGFSIPVAGFLSNYVGAPLDHVIAYGIPSAGIIVTGLVLLTRFLRAYPLPAEEGV